MSVVSVLLDAGPWLAGLGAGLLIFGFIPRLALRLISMVFPKSDDRRREMLAELHVVPRWERPFWVAEQLERAVVEGIPSRIKWAKGRRRRRRLIVNAAAFAGSRSYSVGVRRISPRGSWRGQHSDRARQELVDDLTTELLMDRVLIAYGLRRSRVKKVAEQLVDLTFTGNRYTSRHATAVIAESRIAVAPSEIEPYWRSGYGGGYRLKTSGHFGEDEDEVLVTLMFDPVHRDWSSGR